MARGARHVHCDKSKNSVDSYEGRLQRIKVRLAALGRIQESLRRRICMKRVNWPIDTRKRPFLIRAVLYLVHLTMYRRR